MWLKHICGNHSFMRDAGALRAFRKNEGGAAIVIIGLTMPVLIGALGLATEVSYWLSLRSTDFKTEPTMSPSRSPIPQPPQAVARIAIP